jgi:hypothetical protein
MLSMNDTLSLLRKVLEVCGTKDQLQGFLEDDVYNALAAVGETDFQAAQLALADMRRGNNPKRDLHRAQQAFLDAVLRYEAAANKVLFSTSKEIQFRKKAFEACVLAATCFHHDGDAELTKKYLWSSLNCFTAYALRRVQVALESFFTSTDNTTAEVVRERDAFLRVAKKMGGLQPPEFFLCLKWHDTDGRIIYFIGPDWPRSTEPPCRYCPEPQKYK